MLYRIINIKGMSTRHTSQKKAPSSPGYYIPMVFQDQPDVQTTIRISFDNYAFLCDFSDFVRGLLPNDPLFDGNRTLTLFGGKGSNILSGKPTADIDVAIQNGPLGPSVKEQLEEKNVILVSEGKQFLCSKHTVVSEDGKLSTEIIGEISESHNEYSTVTFDTLRFGKIDLVKTIIPGIMDASANSICITMNQGYKFKVFATTTALWELFNDNVFPLQLKELLSCSFSRRMSRDPTKSLKVQTRFARVLRRLWKLINKFETVQCVSTEGGEDPISLDEVEHVTEMKQLLDLMITPVCGHPLTVRTLYGQVMSKLTTERDGEQVDTQDLCPMCRAELRLPSEFKKLFTLEDLHDETFRTKLAENYGIHVHKYPITVPETKTEVEKLRDLLFVEDDVHASHAAMHGEVGADGAGDADGAGGAGGAGGPDLFRTPPRAPRRSLSSEFRDVDDYRVGSPSW